MRLDVYMCVRVWVCVYASWNNGLVGTTVTAFGVPWCAYVVSVCVEIRIYTVV